jgi:hypothetical protein
MTTEAEIYTLREETLRKFGPKTADHPSVGAECKACHQPLKAGDYTTLIPLGPGDDPEEQAKAAAGRPYNSIALEVHWTCATGLGADLRVRV